MKSILLVFAILLCGLGAPNYQLRYIYYDEDDHVCTNYDVKDFVRVKVQVDGKDLFKQEVWAGTLCMSGYVYPENIIAPGKVWGIINSNEKTSIKITDVAKYEGQKDWLWRIKQNSTILQPSLIKGVPYDCQIVGDGTVKHYGVGIPGEVDCEYDISCKRLEAIKDS